MKSAPAVGEFGRLRNDMHCYREFAYAFNLKVKAAQRVLNYQWARRCAAARLRPRELLQLGEPRVLRSAS